MKFVAFFTPFAQFNVYKVLYPGTAGLFFSFSSSVWHTTVGVLLWCKRPQEAEPSGRFFFADDSVRCSMSADWQGLFDSIPRAVSKLNAESTCPGKTIYVNPGESCLYLRNLGLFTSNAQIQQLNPNTSCSSFFTSSAALCLATGAYSTVLLPFALVTSGSSLLGSTPRPPAPLPSPPQMRCASPQVCTAPCPSPRDPVTAVCTCVTLLLPP